MPRRRMSGSPFPDEDSAGSVAIDNFSVQVVPEPTPALLLLGSGAMLLLRRRRTAV